MWQGRFCSFPLSESYLLAAARYVERNPVRAGLAERPEAYPWSSAAAHIAGRDDVLVRVSPPIEIVGDWGGFLSPEEGKEGEEIRRHERMGRPLGNEAFIIGIENLFGRILRKQKPGPKAKAKQR